MTYVNHVYPGKGEVCKHGQLAGKEGEELIRSHCESAGVKTTSEQRVFGLDSSYLATTNTGK